MFDGLLDGYTQSLLIFAGINVIAAYSFYAPFKTGQVSLGQAGFMAVGAYASAILTQKFGLPFAAALIVRRPRRPASSASLVGFPALRIKGIYLLLLTLGFAEIIAVIALSWEYVGGAQGFRNISFNPYTLEYVIGIIVVLILFFARLERSSLGRTMDSIHQDETAAEVMGIDVVRTKLSGVRPRRGHRGPRRRALRASRDLHGFDHLQHHAGGRNPDVRGGRRRQHLLGAAARRGCAQRHPGVAAGAARMAGAPAGRVDEFLSDEPRLRRSCMASSISRTPSG